MRIRFRAGTLWSGAAWSSAGTIAYTSSGPALLPYGGVLWLAYREATTNAVTFKQMSTSGTWSGASTLPGAVQTDSDIALAEFGGNLYVFYRPVGAGSQPIRYFVRSGGTWSGPGNTSASSDSGPAAAVVDNRLYLVYRRGTGASNLYYRYLETSLFSAEQQIGRQTATHVAIAAADGSPTVASYRGRLHVAARSTDGASRYSSYCYCPSTPCGCTYRPGEWTQTVRLPHQMSSGPPVLYTDAGDATIGTPLYLAYPSGSNVLWDYKVSE
jgi:hypothetical protein